MPALVYSPSYGADIGAHVFPVQKYGMVRDQLLASGSFEPEAFLLPRSYGTEVLQLVHRKDYLDDLLNLRQTQETMRSELPLDQPILNWFLTAVDGTITATAEALGCGAAFHIGGGFHHAYPGHAEGFCYLNDVGVASAFALKAGWVEKVSVVDLDVHQGNGTARMFQGEDRVFTFSMHQQNNYPMPKEKGDLDVGLRDRMGDEEYLQQLDEGLAKSIYDQKPNLVQYVAGADPYHADQLGGLSLSFDGLRARDRMVYEAAKQVGAVVVATTAGGYAVRAEDTAKIHTNAVLEMLEVWPQEDGLK
ncbi:MAG: histone deacetylase [Candidatus Eisenbacteria bacterium]|uniref:Histone deacetylase n=1 Tax=Eiseniibacteriota bacterium TaxID=2212470 RepID=A0A7Y2E964_UNCEI|nr:histone deacetylase [Candidatus Eisenbacteria bacterium]